VLTNNVFRAVNLLLDDSPCPVCAKRMTVRFSLDPAGRVFIYFGCHGSHQVYTLDDTLMNETQVVDAIMRFADQVFADEARSPDLRELIAYNRGATPVSPC